MTSITKALAKGTIGTVAAGAMAMASASPAFASDRHRDRGIDGKDILAGAIVLGGIAAVAAAASSGRDRDRHHDRRYRGYDDRYYGHRGRHGVSEREAVNMCIRAAERTAQRYGGTRAEVYDIRDVDRERRGFEVKGRIAVREGYGSRYNDRWGYDRRGYDRRGRNYRNGDGWDEGRFTCDVRRGRVVDIDFKGIRGL